MTAVSARHDVSPDRGAHILARLDRLPVLRTHIVWITLIAINMMIEYYDNGLNIPLASELARDPHANTAPDQVGTVISFFYGGMIVGALLAGRLADRYGRRSTLLWFTILYSLASLMTLALPIYDWLLVSRFITGVGVQGVTSILVMLMVEMFPSRSRGRFVAVSTIAFTVSAPLLAGLAAYILPRYEPGAWRWLFLLGGLGLVIAPILWKKIPESPRWLITQGRADEAEALVVRLEDEARAAGAELVEPEPVAGVQQRHSLRDLLRSPRAVKTIFVVAIGWFGATLGLYLNQNFSIDLLIKTYIEEGTPTDSAIASGYKFYLIASCIYVITPVLTWFLIGRLERKTLVLVSSLAASLAITAMAYGTVPVYLIGMCSAGVLTGVVFSVYYAYIPESVPTEYRGVGAGIIFGIGRVGAMVTGILYTALFFSAEDGGTWGLGRPGVMMTAVASYLIGALVIVLFGPKTAGRSLESVAAEEYGSRTDSSGR